MEPKFSLVKKVVGVVQQL